VTRLTQDREDVLAFIAAALQQFGPTCRLRLEIGETRAVFTFPPDPSWRPPVIQAPASISYIAPRRREEPFP
jgi:hypothetical protein